MTFVGYDKAFDSVSTKAVMKELYKNVDQVKDTYRISPKSIITKQLKSNYTGQQIGTLRKTTKAGRQ